MTDLETEIAERASRHETSRQDAALDELAYRYREMERKSRNKLGYMQRDYDELRRLAVDALVHRDPLSIENLHRVLGGDT